MEVYKFQRNRNKKTLNLFIFSYFLILVMQLFTEYMVVEVVQENPNYLNSFFVKEKQKKSQKIFVLKNLLMNRVSPEGVNFTKSNFKVGDIVYVSSAYPVIKKNFKYWIRTILHIVSVGIIQEPYTSAVFRKVIAVPGDKVVYNTSTIISVNGPSIHFIESSPNGIPLLDQPKETTLRENEYFLVGIEDYSIDGRLLGVTDISDIKGKSILLLGPKWGIIK